MKKKKKVILVAVIMTILLASFAIVIIVSNSKANLEQLAGMEIENIDFKDIPNGVYSGSYKVFPVKVEVMVTVNNHKISDIELVKHNHGQGADAEVIIDRVLETQTLGLDVITGATYSSKIILKAIENALIDYK